MGFGLNLLLGKISLFLPLLCLCDMKIWGFGILDNWFEVLCCGYWVVLEVEGRVLV